MATLTETAYYARRAINWMALAFIAYFILKIIWTVLAAVIIAIFPPKATPPNHAFGILPAVKFPNQATPSAGITFRLETIEGTVPQASSAGITYFMPKSASNLLALPRTQQFAQKLSFSTREIQETKNLYRFTDPEFPLRTLRYDIITNNFTLQYAYGLDTGLFSEDSLPTVETAKKEAAQFLDSNGVLPVDYSTDSFSVSYLKLVGDELVKTPTITQANAIRVDAKRSNVNGLPVYTAIPDEGPISIVISPSKINKKRILSVSYIYWPIEYQTTATYKLKTSSEAWEELKAGGGYIARYPTNGTEAVIRSVHLGYYDSLGAQTYLQPIFVFEGDGDFIAYVPAVAKPWTE